METPNFIKTGIDRPTIIIVILGTIGLYGLIPGFPMDVTTNSISLIIVIVDRFVMEQILWALTTIKFLFSVVVVPGVIYTGYPRVVVPGKLSQG